MGRVSAAARLIAVFGALIGLSVAATGCQQVDVVATRVRGAGGASGASGAGGAGGAGGGVDAGSPAHAGACPYRARDLGSSGMTTQDEFLASRLTQAICTCEALATSAALDLDAYDGASGPYQSGGPGADLGVDQELSVGAGSSVSGSIVVAGSSGLSLTGTDAPSLSVGGDLAVKGPLAGPGTVHVSGDARVGDRIQLNGLSVGGTLTQPPGAGFDVASSPRLGGVSSAAVRVDPPCECGPDAQLVLATPALSAKAASVSAGRGPLVLNQDCGEFALGSFDAGGLQLDVRKRAALYVTSDLHLTGDLVVTTANAADLDLFVLGNLKVDGMLRVGSKDSPAQVRIYIGDTGTAQLGGGGELHGVLYAPLAEIVIEARLTVYGAIVARRIAAMAPIDLHYDQSLPRG